MAKYIHGIDPQEVILRDSGADTWDGVKMCACKIMISKVYKKGEMKVPLGHFFNGPVPQSLQLHFFCLGENFLAFYLSAQSTISMCVIFFVTYHIKL